MRVGALIGAVLLAAAGAATFAWSPAPAPAEAPAGPPMPSPAEMLEFEATAQKSCRCARKARHGGGSAEGCWTELEQKVDRYQPGNVAAACGIFSPVMICFGDEFAESCVTTDFGGGACTAEEAKLLEAMYDHAAGPRGENLKQASKAHKKAVEALIRGGTLTPPPGSRREGCI